ncbi:MAG: response regulator [Desulfobacter sp.]|uniref:sigma-54-dependent transcriptional regulator n=1 Tax=Desulfobacter sp. TaxID=2294 RepID=UPI001B516954|nr:response regulator [Desulfobacter sp.]MBP8828115.1 response regulator [Desulfobacter sp.]MBP9598106.1 response regulator [Desulfobacter sp.]
MVKIPVKILIVDDEKDFVEMFYLRLTKQGEKVSTAFSGQEALDLLEKTQIDVVILDIRMPGMDGIETLKKIKESYPLVEVILLTGHGSTETAVEGMKAGAFEYLMKPADFEDISQKLANAWKRKDEQEERIRKAEARLLLRRTWEI